MLMETRRRKTVDMVVVGVEGAEPIEVEVPGRAPLTRATVLEETLIPLEGEEADVGGVRGVTCRMI